MADYSAYFAIERKLKAQGFEEDRAEIIHNFTDGKKSSLKSLTPFEYAELLRVLNTQYNNPGTVVLRKAAQKFDYAVENLKRRKIIALFCKMGYLKGVNPDMERINNWAVTHGHKKMNLNDYHNVDLQKLVFQAEKVYESYIKTL